VIARPQDVLAARQIINEGIEIGPQPQPCVCGAERYEHGGSNATGKCERTSCRRYRFDPVWVLVYAALAADGVGIGQAIADADEMSRAKHYRANPRKPGQWSIGASDTQTCPRKIQYRNAPPPDLVPASEDSREARIGTMIHNDTTRQLRVLYPWRLFDMKVTIAGLDRESALDMFDPITGVVTDVKTAGDWRWDRLGDDGPDWTTWEQVLLYALALAEMGYLITAVRLAYIKRCNGHDENFEMEWDDEAIAAAEAARDRLIGYAQSLDLGLDLPKTGTGPSTDALCRRCFARNDCWNIPLAEQLGRSPENVTILGTHPEDAEIAHAIALKVERSAARLAAKKVEDEAAALVDGIQPGRYGPNGEFEAYTKRTGNTPLYKAAFEQTLDYLELPDGMRPTKDVVTVPRTPSGRTVVVGRTRKAVLEAEAREARKAAKAAAKADAT
jgi:hypothetical protein